MEIALALQILQLLVKETPAILDAAASLKAKLAANGTLTDADWDAEDAKFNPDLSDPLGKIPTPS